MAHAVLGGAAGLVWLVLPGMTISTDVPVAISTDTPVAAAPEDEETSAADLVLPLVVVAAVGALAGYGYVRRTRRARARTTPGGTHTAPSAAPLTELDDQSRILLTEADNWIRTSREELSFAEARSGPTAVAPFTRAVRDAESELSAAFRIRRQYDAGVPEDGTSRRHALTGIVGRCQEAGRRLDEEAAAFDRLRALEGDIGEALTVAETRFRELAGQVGTTEAVLADLGERYAPSASEAVAGYPEQAKDRLVFATTHLNQARQAADRGEQQRATGDLRTAEEAVARAAVLITGVERLAAELSEAMGLIPAVLTGAEAEIAGAARVTGVPVGEVRARVHHANAVLAALRQELTSGQPYDPLGVLRRIVQAVSPVATGRTGVLPAAALLTARSAAAVAADFVTTHRSTVGATARTLLAEAERLLATGSPSDRPSADELALRAREIAEWDVRAHGSPYTEAVGPAESFGGPGSRNRRAFSAT